MGETNFQQRQLKARSGVVLWIDDQLLLMRQNGKDFWVLPGGTLEEGESLADCAKRELMEEAGLEVQIGDMLALGELIDEKRQVIDVFFEAEYLSGPKVWQAPHPENIDEIRLIPRSELETLSIRPNQAMTIILGNHQEKTYLGLYS